MVSKSIAGGQSSWRSPRSAALRSLPSLGPWAAAKVNFYRHQKFDPLHQRFILVDTNSVLGGKSSFWSSPIRSFAENRKMYILINFDRNRRAAEVQGRMPTCPQGPGQMALHRTNEAASRSTVTIGAGSRKRTISQRKRRLAAIV